jgi:uncharacterized protein (DUF433 family)
MVRNMGSPDMENLSNGIKATSGQRRGASKPNKAKDGRLDKTNPRSRAVNRSRRADEFGAFADEILRDLNPRGPLQRLAADHVVHSAWRLKGSLEKQAAREFGEKSDPDPQVAKGRRRSTELDLSSRSLKEAVETFAYLRDRAPAAPEAPAIVHDYEADFDVVEDNIFPAVKEFGSDFDAVEDDIFPNEWPVVPSECPVDLPEEPGSSDEEVPSWRDRLVYDFDVSDISPVVKGTWVTVSHVVSLIVDGWSWADILRSHPELTEQDIRTCVAYAMDEENTAP